MKSVELVGSSGFWFCSSVTSKLRNWLDVRPELDEEEVVVAAVVVVVAVVAATSWRAPAMSGRDAPRNCVAGIEVVLNSVLY